MLNAPTSHHPLSQYIREAVPITPWVFDTAEDSAVPTHIPYLYLPSKPALGNLQLCKFSPYLFHMKCGIDFPEFFQ
jgi:hypothetical protein